MLRAIASRIEQSFTLLVLLAALSGMAAPDGFLWAKPYIPFMLGCVMFGIGLTIGTDQLSAILKRPAVGLFALGKFLVMPLLAYASAKLLQLPPEALVGMVILGACPGGVAANVMSYLARANTALTVLLTIATTLLSPFATPLIIYIFLHQHVSIDMAAMMEKLFWVVLFPLLDAIVLRRFLARPVERIQWVFPPLSILMIVLIIGFVAAANRQTLLDHPWLVLLSVTLFNLGGYAIGYALAHAFRQDPGICRAVAFEYGMQDSALGIIIATGFFSTLAALPSALCSLVQNLTGPWLARRFSNARS